MSYILSYQFQVKDFKSNSETIYSPIFAMNNLKWRLEVEPRGNEKKTHISIFLRCFNPPPDTKNLTFFQLYVQHGKGRVENVITVTNAKFFFTENDSIACIRDFIPYSAYPELTFGVDMTFSTESPKLPFFEKLNDPEFSDVIFIIEDQKLYVSRFILTSYSTYFYKLFQQRTVEPEIDVLQLIESVKYELNNPKPKSNENDKEIEEMLESTNLDDNAEHETTKEEQPNKVLQTNEMHTIALKNTAYNAVFKAFLYMYTGILDNNYKIEEYIELYGVASVFHLEGLCEEIRKVLMVSISYKSFSTILAFASEFKLDIIWSKVIMFVFNEWLSLKDSEEMKNIIFSEDKEFLKSFVNNLMQHKILK